MLNKSQIKEILRQYNIRPSRFLGQNFLIDRNVRDKIIDFIELTDKDLVIEIGPGLGSLTEVLCKIAKKVIAVEKDKRLCEFLKENFQGVKNLEIVCMDFLKFCLPPEKSKVIGNLPFFITAPILTKLIEERGGIDSVYITVQKEFAERLVAKSGQSNYSPITLFVQFYSSPKSLFSIKKRSFFPPPEVEAVFLKLKFLDKALFSVKDEEVLFKVIRGAFGKRRKTLLNSLSALRLWKSKEEVLGLLEKVGISPFLRPEEISMEGYVKISENIGGLVNYGSIDFLA